MKKITLLMLLVLVTSISKAQSDVEALIAAGVEDAERFANDYLAPGTNGLMHSMNANWFNSGKAKPLGGFEISIIANAATVKEESKSFFMDENDYMNVEFRDGASAQDVATVFGENESDVVVLVTYEDPVFGNYQEEVVLPSGIGSENVSLLPTAFIQGALGLSNGIEVKARFVPKIETEDVALSMYGVGLQFEMTSWLPADKVLPVAISGLVAYTHADTQYDLTENSGLDGSDQRLENDTNTWLFQLIASTKMPVINFYGGLGYIKGKSESDLLGEYIVTNGFATKTVEDPFSVSSEVAAVRGTLGTKLKLGFFRINAEYHMSKFNTFSLGINFGFR